MALGSFNLFVAQVEKASLSLRVKALQTMFDMMVLFPNDPLYAKTGEQVWSTLCQESPVSKILINFQTQEDLVIESLTSILQENAAEM
jgi:hypothetical protein